MLSGSAVRITTLVVFELQPHRVDRGDAREAVTTALNGRFVPRDAREHTLLAPGDALTLFHAIVGG